MRREGWKVNHKYIYRLYRQEQLMLKTKYRKKRASHTRMPLTVPMGPNERWSMDFMMDRLENGSRFRILTVVDQFTKYCPLLAAERSMTGTRVSSYLTEASLIHGLPKNITVDNGSEFYSQAMDSWAYRKKVQLDFIRPGRPVDNAYIESFNSRLRDELLNVELFWDLEDARIKLESWRKDYNSNRPHSALGDLTPEEYQTILNGDRDRVPDFSSELV